MAANLVTELFIFFTLYVILLYPVLPFFQMYVFLITSAFSHLCNNRMCHLISKLFRRVGKRATIFFLSYGRSFFFIRIDLLGRSFCCFYFSCHFLKICKINLSPRYLWCLDGRVVSTSDQTFFFFFFFEQINFL